MAASEPKCNINNTNLDKKQKKSLFFNFDTSHANQTNKIFSDIVNINKNLKETNEKKC